CGCPTRHVSPTMTDGPSQEVGEGSMPDADASAGGDADANGNGDVRGDAPGPDGVDKTKPTVVSVTPLSNAAGVSLGMPIKGVFPEPMLASSVMSAVTITSSAMAVPATASLSADGMTLTLTITDRSKLALPAMFSGAVASTATDLAGNALAAPYTWTWNV